MDCTHGRDVHIARHAHGGVYTWGKHRHGGTYARCDLHRGGIHQGDIYTEGHTHGGDIYMEKPINIRKNIHTEETYTPRDKEGIYTWKNIYTEGYTHGGGINTKGAHTRKGSIIHADGMN